MTENSFCSQASGISTGLQKRTQTLSLLTWHRTNINLIDYITIDDVIIIASKNQDKTIDSNKVLTSSGVYDLAYTFDNTVIGSKSTIVLNKNNEIVSIIPYNQNKEKYSSKKLRVVLLNLKTLLKIKESYHKTGSFFNIIYKINLINTIYSFI